MCDHLKNLENHDNFKVVNDTYGAFFIHESTHGLNLLSAFRCNEDRKHLQMWQCSVVQLDKPYSVDPLFFS